MNVKTLAISLSIIFLSLAILGSFGAHEALSHSVTCVGSLAQQADCPGTLSGFEFVSFHLNGLRSFSTGLSVAALLTILVFGFAVFAGELPGIELLLNRSIAYSEFRATPNLSKFRRFLLQFEKRDPLAA